MRGEEGGDGHRVGGARFQPCAHHKLGGSLRRFNNDHLARSSCPVRVPPGGLWWTDRIQIAGSWSVTVEAMVQRPSGTVAEEGLVV